MLAILGVLTAGFLLIAVKEQTSRVDEIEQGLTPVTINTSGLTFQGENRPWKTWTQRLMYVELAPGKTPALEFVFDVLGANDLLFKGTLDHGIRRRVKQFLCSFRRRRVYAFQWNAEMERAADLAEFQEHNGRCESHTW